MTAIQVEGLCDAIRSLQGATVALHSDAPPKGMLDEIIDRGTFRPAEDESIGYWFARFLTVRESLWSVIDEVRFVLDRPVSAPKETAELKLFLVGYAALCLLIRLDRLLLFQVAEDSVIQRKLNEPFPEYRIPRKQFTRLYSAFVDQGNVLSIRDAIRFADRHRSELQALTE